MPKKKSKYRRLSAIGLQIGVNFRGACQLFADKSGFISSPMRLEVHKIGDQRGPPGLVTGTAAATRIRVKVLVK